MDYAATSSISMRTSISNNNGIVFFLEASVPLFTYEYSYANTPSPENDIPDSTEKITKGFVYPDTPFGALAATVMTTRVGAEIPL